VLTVTRAVLGAGAGAGAGTGDGAEVGAGVAAKTGFAGVGGGAGGLAFACAGGLGGAGAAGATGALAFVIVSPPRGGTRRRSAAAAGETAPGLISVSSGFVEAAHAGAGTAAAAAASSPAARIDIVAFRMPRSRRRSSKCERPVGPTGARRLLSRKIMPRARGRFEDQSSRLSILRASTSRLPTWFARLTTPSTSIRSMIRAARL
jgi:hypothetical protein